MSENLRERTLTPHNDGPQSDLQASQDKKRIAVIGAGVIGMSTAYALVRAGHSVVLVDKHSQPGQETSLANGGQLSYRYVSPLPDAGVPLKALRWMLQGADAPLKFRPRLDPRQWRWCLSFLVACRSSVNRENGAHLLRLALYSQQVLGEWRKAGLDGFAWRRNGKLVIYRQADSFVQAAAKVREGDEQRVLSVEQCVALEPALSAIATQLAGGIFSASDESADCQLFCQAMEQAARASGHYQRIEDCVSAIRHGQGRIQALQLASGGTLEADDFVLAAGNASSMLAAPLGIDLQLYPLKGYSLTLALNDSSRCPDVSVTDFDRKIVYARLGDQLRVAAMVDIGAPDATVDPARIAALKQQCQQTFPEAGDYQHASEWAGLRPSTAHGKPILGATHLDNFWLNVGHGSLGLTLAAASAQVLTQLIEHRTSPVDLTGLTLTP
ncbi:amino acid dehydrogenase [Pseudomonas daroniae]|uniref:Amino acid dehydrogenase n=1 Tax=Phytopseudomonas daroniae TaxID=2487519 RepID=A0A4V2KAF4_9GAMM|nr:MULTISPECIES: D-amino acid dehydrogenase [Pseudomonas]TBU75038.1 amino acid dehydrogenase [Pseudomonas daroniae]TBU80410.1 amino acid dehydrogenase [Pseudomonas sp. FRB 228]TBU89137.1 amino acid dehydrogenase [Pseudomonas daroniae]